MNSYIFQTRFRVKEGEVSNRGFRIIPISISSQDKKNDFTPTPITKETTLDSIRTVLSGNAKKLLYGITEYPTEWK